MQALRGGHNIYRRHDQDHEALRAAHRSRSESLPYGAQTADVEAVYGRKMMKTPIKLKFPTLKDRL